MPYLPNAQVLASDLHPLAVGLCLCGLSRTPLISSGGLCLSLICHCGWGYTRPLTKIQVLVRTDSCVRVICED